LISVSDEIKNFLALRSSDANPMTVSTWFSMTMVLFQIQRPYRSWRQRYPC
jgi:hypothetical protein